MVRARCIGLTSLRTEAVLLQSNASPHPVGAPAPGANKAGSVYWFAFASHRGGAPTIERVPPSCRSTRPGCEQGRLRVLVLPSLRTEAVLLQSNASPHPVGASAPGANKAGSVYWFAFASHRGGAPTIERATPPRRSTRPGCEQTIARPTPRPAVRQTERTAPSLPRPL